MTSRVLPEKSFGELWTYWARPDCRPHIVVTLLKREGEWERKDIIALANILSTRIEVDNERPETIQIIGNFPREIFQTIILGFSFDYWTLTGLDNPKLIFPFPRSLID